jgi:hypothetical protein
MPFLPLVLAAVLFLAVLAPERATADGPTLAAVDETVNVRAGRDVDSRRVGRLTPGERVLADDCRNDWCAVTQLGASRPLGYVFASLLKPQTGTLPLSNPVPGTQFTVTPALTVRETVDNNILFQDVGDRETRVSPALVARLQNERSEISLRALADVLRYETHSEFDRTNREFGLSLYHAVNDLARVQLRARALADYTFESAFNESGTVAVKAPRREYTVAPALSYRFGERTEVSLGGEAIATRHSHESDKDMLAKGSNLTLSRFLNESKSALLLRGSDTAYGYKTGDQNVATLAAGADWNLTEILSCRLLAGPALSRDSFPGRHDEEHATHLSLAGEGMLRLKLERLTTEIGGDLGAIPGSRGENTQRRRLVGNTVYDLTEHLDLGLYATWYRANTLGYTAVQDNTVVNLSPSVEYALSEHSRVRLAYSYTCIDDHINDLYRQGQGISLSLHLEYPRSFQ